MKLKSVQRYDCSICFRFVGATFQGTDRDVEDEDADLCNTEEEEEPRRKEPKKDKGQGCKLAPVIGHLSGKFEVLTGKLLSLTGHSDGRLL